MKILLSAATEGEISRLRGINPAHHTLDYLITGIGMVATTYSLTRYFSHVKPDLAINCGIAGTFNNTIALGEVVRVQKDIFSELGAEDDAQFLNLQQLGLSGQDTYQESSGILTPGLRNVNGITVNTVHGNIQSIEKITKHLNPDVESMEGAAFFHVCQHENIASLQIRAISNYIEKRDRNAWNIPLALENLILSLNQLLNELG